jgi:hypothetical protein
MTAGYFHRCYRCYHHCYRYCPHCHYFHHSLTGEQEAVVLAVLAVLANQQLSLIPCKTSPLGPCSVRFVELV